MTDIFNTNDYAVLREHDSVAKAAQVLIERKVEALPVVDEAGILLGVFSADRLLAMLLPRVATLEAGVGDLAFVSDTVDDLREKMRTVAARPLGEFIEHDATVVHRDTPLPEIMLLLYRGENDLPLVERGSNKLLGVVSAVDLLCAVCEGAGQ